MVLLPEHLLPFIPKDIIRCLFLEGFPNSFISSKMFADFYNVPACPPAVEIPTDWSSLFTLFLCVCLFVLYIGKQGLERACD